MKRKSHIPSEAQRWAQKRNWSKGMVVGMIGIINTLTKNKILTVGEQVALNVLQKRMREIIEEWNGNNLTSKELYLCS